MHLANDPAFVEFFAALGKRIETEGPADNAGKITFAFRLCLCREPATEESKRILKYLDSQKANDPKTAWAQVSRVLINLDEFVTRE